jgi:hypothetical protein
LCDAVQRLRLLLAIAARGTGRLLSAQRHLLAQLTFESLQAAVQVAKTHRPSARASVASPQEQRDLQNDHQKAQRTHEAYNSQASLI